MKNCPYCGGELSPGASKCRHCGEWVVNPSQQPFRRQSDYGAADPYEYTYEDNESDLLSPEGNDRDRNTGNEGFFRTYFIKAFFGRYADFSGYLGLRDFWLSMLAAFIITLGLIGIVFAINWFLIPLAQTIIWYCVSILWLGLLFVPFFALSTRRLRDAGYKAYWNLAIVVPFAGILVLAYLWLQPERHPHPVRRVQYTGGDIGLGILCIAMLLLGMLMASGSFGYFGSNALEGEIEYDSVDEEALFGDSLLNKQSPGNELPTGYDSTRTPSHSTSPSVNTSVEEATESTTETPVTPQTEQPGAPTSEESEPDYL